MTTYLSMNGTLSDYLNLPNNLTFDSIEIDSEVYSGSQVQSIFGETQADINVSTSNVVSSNNSSATITQNITVGTRGILKFSLSPAYTVSSGNASIARGYGYYANYHAKMDIYDIKVYNAGVLVAHYDMSTGTVNDQSGNGNNATLVGGTWGGGSTGSTYIGSGTVTGQSSLTSAETMTMEASGTAQGQSSTTSSETKSYASNGTGNGTSVLSSVDNVIYVDFGSSQGNSTISSSETLISHTGTMYSVNGQANGMSSLNSSDKVTFESSNTTNGQSALTSNEHESLSARGNTQGQSSIITSEQFIGHATTSYSGIGLSDGASNVSSFETKSYVANGLSYGISNAISHDNIVFFPIGSANGYTTINTTERYVSVFEVIGIIELNGQLQLTLQFVGVIDLNINLKGVV